MDYEYKNMKKDGQEGHMMSPVAHLYPYVPINRLSVKKAISNLLTSTAS